MKRQVKNETLEMYFKISMKDNYIKSHLEELIYCYDNDKSLIDFEWWTHIEDLLNKKISYQEYLKIDSQYDGDLMELDETNINDILNMLHNNGSVST